MNGKLPSPLVGWVSPNLVDNQLSSFSGRFLPLFFVSYRTQVSDSGVFSLPVIPRFLWFTQGQWYSFFYIFYRLGCRQKRGE